MARSHWLVKQDPTVYSFARLQKDKKTAWTGVRDHQARNNLAAMKKGDRVLLYQSVVGEEVVGVCEVVREYYPDPTSDDPAWVAVDLKAFAAFAHPVSLDVIKAEPRLAALRLLRQSSPSVMPLEKAAFDRVVALGARAPGGTGAKKIARRAASRARSGVDARGHHPQSTTLPAQAFSTREGTTAPSSLASRARAMIDHLDRMLRTLVLSGGDDPPLRISRSEIAVLETLGAEDAMGMGQLAERVRLPLSTATRVVDRLVMRKLVLRERPRDNRRVVRVALASAGRRLYDEALAVKIAGAERVLEYLTADEQAELLRLYGKMSRGIADTVGY